MSTPLFLAAVFLGPAMLALLTGACNAARRSARNAWQPHPAARRKTFPAKQPMRTDKPRGNAPQKAPEPDVSPQSNATHQAKPEAERTETVPAAARPFSGEIVAFTGTCLKLDRRAMIAHTARLGGKAYETINTRCTLLVVGEKPGKNQLDRAAKWHTKTIAWQEWYTIAFGKNALPAPQDVQGITLDEFAAMIDAA